MVSLVGDIGDGCPADPYASYPEEVLRKIPHPTPPNRMLNLWRRDQQSGGEDP
jgi:hypothetical protein